MKPKSKLIKDNPKQDEEMSERPITTMAYEEFQLLIDRFIERSSQEFGEMPASVFFELLFEHLANDRTETSELDSDI